MTSASDNLATLVDDMLQDAGCGQDAELRDALLSLGTMASLPVPAPTGELAALLAAGVPPTAEVPDSGEPDAEQPGGPPQEEPGVQPQDELARRRRRHRPTALGLVLVAGMGLGVGGVAASTTAPGGNAIEQVLEEWAPWSRPAADASAAGDGAGAASPGYRAPQAAADGEPASTAAPGAAADAANPASRLLRGHAGLSGNFPPCTSPVRLAAEQGTAKCGATGDNGSSEAAAQGNGAGSGKGNAGPAGADGTTAGPGSQGVAKAEPPAASTPAGAQGTAGAGAQKPAGSAGNAGQGQPQSQTQGQSQGGNPGNAQKGAFPAK